MDTINFNAEPDVVSAAEAHRQLAARTQHLEIVSAAGFTQAAEHLKDIKTEIAKIEAARVRITKPLNATLDEVNAQAKSAKAPYLETEAQIKRSILTYNQAEERKRQDEQRRQDEIARKERVRLQAIADEAAAKAAREAADRRRAADEAAAAGRAEEAAKLQQQAARIEERGQAKQDQFESRAATTVAAVVQTEAPKVGGVSMRDNWTYRIVDATKINAQFLIPNDVKIGKLVKSLKKEAEALIGPGVQVFNEPLIASGRA